MFLEEESIKKDGNGWDKDKERATNVINAEIERMADYNWQDESRLGSDYSKISWTNKYTQE